MTRTQLADLPAFPNHIESCQVSAEFLIAVQAGGANRSAQGRSGKVVWKRYRLTDRGLVEIGDGGEQREQYATQKLYLVLDEPTAPMSPAWASVLKYPCSWASKDTVEIDAAKEVTFGVFWYPPGFAYPTNTATYWVGDDQTFYLRALLEQFDSPVHGNCVDTSAMDVVCKNALGLSFRMRQLTSDPSAFMTNSLCLVGSNATQWQYYQQLWDNPEIEGDVYWAWHSLAVPSETELSDSDPIYSACEALWVDLTGSYYRNPPAHHTAHSWTQKDYWQKPSGQVRYGLWALPVDLYESDSPIRFTYYDSGDWTPVVTTANRPW